MLSNSTSPIMLPRQFFFYPSFNEVLIVPCPVECKNVKIALGAGAGTPNSSVNVLTTSLENHVHNLTGPVILELFDVQLQK